MKRIWIVLALAGFPAGAFSLQQDVSFGCPEAGSGKMVEQTITTSNRLMPKILVEIHARNLAGTSSDPKAVYTCEIRWQVFSATDPTRPLLDYSQTIDHDEIGLKFVGLSPDRTKLLFNFWTAAGDFNDDRPAVYDIGSQTGMVRDVGERVLNELGGGCAYNSEVTGVRNDGNVIVTVPAIYDDPKGCPARGEWLLDMKTDKLTRVQRVPQSGML